MLTKEVAEKVEIERKIIDVNNSIQEREFLIWELEDLAKNNRLLNKGVKASVAELEAEIKTTTKGEDK